MPLYVCSGYGVSIYHYSPLSHSTALSTMKPDLRYLRSIALIGSVINNQELLAARASFKLGIVGVRGGRDDGRRAKRSDFRTVNTTIGVRIGIHRWRQRGGLSHASLRCRHIVVRLPSPCRSCNTKLQSRVATFTSRFTH